LIDEEVSNLWSFDLAFEPSETRCSPCQPEARQTTTHIPRAVDTENGVHEDALYVPSEGADSAAVRSEPIVNAVLAQPRVLACDVASQTDEGVVSIAGLEASGVLQHKPRRRLSWTSSVLSFGNLPIRTGFVVAILMSFWRLMTNSFGLVGLMTDALLLWMWLHRQSSAPVRPLLLPIMIGKQVLVNSRRLLRTSRLPMGFRQHLTNCMLCIRM
jgi:hypothetical protein